MENNPFDRLKEITISKHLNDIIIETIKEQKNIDDIKTIEDLKFTLKDIRFEDKNLGNFIKSISDKL